MNLISAILLFFSWPFSFDQEAIQEINAIKEQMKGYYNTNLDSAAILAETILIKSQKANYELGKAKGEFALAHIAYKRGKISVAIPHFLKALEIYKPLKSNDSLTDQANIYIMLGVIFRRHQSFQEALSFYDLGIKAAIAANNKSALRSLLYNKSIAYRRKGNFAGAIQTLIESVDLIPKDNHIITQKTYNQFGLIYAELGEHDEARKWYNKMIELESKNSSPRYYRGQAYHNMALSYNNQEDYVMAWKYYILAKEEKKLLGNPEKLFITYQNMAELALADRKSELAIDYANKALALIDQVPNTPEYYKIFKFLAQCESAHNPTLAITYANQFIASSEAFNNRQKELLDNGDRYKVQLIASNYFSQVKREKERLKVAWTMSCAAAFIFLAVILSIKLYRIYNYRSPELALSHIKNQNEMIYLLDMFRKEKEEMKNTLRQRK